MTREEAITLIKPLMLMMKNPQGEVISDAYYALDMAIKALEQEPKTGHWIYNRTRDWNGECKYECSECGMGSDVDYDYCMRCGIRMVKS